MQKYQSSYKIMAFAILDTCGKFVVAISYHYCISYFNFDSKKSKIRFINHKFRIIHIQFFYCNADDSSKTWKCNLLQENLIQNCGLNALFSITLKTYSGVTP